MNPFTKEGALRIWFGWLTALLFAVGWGPAAAANDTGAVSAALDADGRTFTVTAPFLISFRAGFSATVELDGSTQELSSAAGTVIGPTTHSTESTPYGQAAVTETTIRFASPWPCVPRRSSSAEAGATGGEIQAPATQGGRELQLDLLFRLGHVPGVTGLVAQAGIRNSMHLPVRLIALTPVAMDAAGPTGRVARTGCGLQPAGRPEGWLITGLQTSVLWARALNEFSEPQTFREAGGFYRQGDRTGFLFGPVGRPTAYLTALFSPVRDGTLLFNLSADMSGAQVDPGETRWGQQVVLLSEPPQAAVARWAEWVGKTHGARTDKGALSGWNSWNFLKRKEISREMFAVADTVLQSGGRLHPEVIQIDEALFDGRQVLNAAWLPRLAQSIGETGARMGLRLGFDRNAKPPAPDSSTGLIEVTETVRRMVQSGFTYLKIFCPPAAECAAGEKRTAFEIYRDDWAAIRKAAGENTYLLNSDRGPDRAAVGSVDASRIGPDADRQSIRTVMNDVLRSYPLQGRWFAVDPDVYYMAAKVEGAREMAGSWPLVRTWISMVGLYCGAAITPDPWYQESIKPYWHIVETMTPPAKERTEVLDLCVFANLQKLVGRVHREWGDSTVALLWNDSAVQSSVRFDFAQAGLDAKRRYAVWSFWDNQFLGVVKGSWTTPALVPSASQHLCFTDLDRTPDRPVLIGSSLHIYCGAAEIKRMASSRDAMVIELTDAGARGGDLFVFSRWPPVLRSATGCAITGVFSAGKDVWRIGVSARQREVLQRMEFSVQLPVTRQAWFWTLIAAVALSLAFAAWRYLAWLRLRRENALARAQAEAEFTAVWNERNRMARELHDTLAQGLGAISVQLELVKRKLPADSGARGLLEEARLLTKANLADARNAIWSMRSQALETGDLASALNGILQSRPARSGAQSAIRVVGEPRRLAPVAENNLLRIGQEAIANAVRHARSKHIEVILEFLERQVRLIVRDDGQGFDAARPPREGGLGLVGMRERAEQLHGQFSVTSEPGSGTVVTVVVPG